MEDDIKSNPKYQKVLVEYQKLRASAKVLKNAVIEEKGKVSSLEENLRLTDQQQRRLSSDNDSLMFRNKQLEFRVQVLQEELQKSIKTRSGKNSNANNQTQPQQLDPILADELEKKIIENAQLSSSISDKNHQIDMLNHRLRDIEQWKSETEKKSRIELEHLNNKVAELELKLAGIANHNENDDISLGAASDSTIPVHMTLASDERIQFLEKELNFYRHQYEVLKLNNSLQQNSPLSTVGIREKDIVDSSGDSKSQQDRDEDDEITLSKEEKIYQYFTSTFEKILSEKSESDSKATNYMKECEMLKENLEILLENLQQKENETRNLKSNFDRMEEDSITTRLNYEEQIQLLTEQVLLLTSE